MKQVVISLLACFLALPVDACIWVYGTGKDLQRRQSGIRVTSLARTLEMSIQTDLREEGRVLEASLRGKEGFYDRNDYAVALMYLGRATEAVELLKALEEQSPDQYETAANLGTAYELAGKNREAKFWIAKGIERNGDSHEGTEWLHVAILEAKLRAEDDPSYFQRGSVLNVDYRSVENRDGKVLVAGKPRPLKEVTTALEYQLTERLKFVKGADAVVASLLFDYAMLEAETGTLEDATKLLALARDYGYAPARIDRLVSRYQALIRIAGLRLKLFHGGGGALALAALLFCYKRGWLVISSRNAKPRAVTLG